MSTPPADRFAIVPLSTPGHAPDDAIVVGPLREVTEYIGQSIARADAIEQLHRARFSVDQIAGLQDKTRGVQVSMVAEAIKQLDARMNALAQQRSDAALARQRRDEEEEAKRIQDELAALPDPDAPPPLLSKEPAPSLELEDTGELPEFGEQPAHGDPPGTDPDLDPDIPRTPVAAGLD